MSKKNGELTHAERVFAIGFVVARNDGKAEILSGASRQELARLLHANPNSLRNALRGVFGPTMPG